MRNATLPRVKASSGKLRRLFKLEYHLYLSPKAAGGCATWRRCS